MSPRRSRLRLLVTLLTVGVALPFGLHLAVTYVARLTPPQLESTPHQVDKNLDPSRGGSPGQALRTRDLLIARLAGTPEELGARHAQLLYAPMVETERRFLSRFAEYVPNRVARWLLTDLAQLRFFDVDRGMTVARRREIAAMAAAYAPDPFSSFFPTYQRFVYLNALYDISLSFEESPLLGCTSFFVAGDGGEQHTLFARNFDFEVDPVFDELKTLFVVAEPGRIPYLSLSWPGLVGSVSGVNRSGLTMVVHGGRAGALARTGEPVLHIVRDVLGTAENVEQAYDQLLSHPIMVSHLIVMADAQGHAEVVERIPDRAPHRYRLGQRAVVTNHLIGPSAKDPKNLRILEHTSTLSRQARGQELLDGHPQTVLPETLVSFLRDRRGVGGTDLPLGDRRALGALIAAHGFVVDLTARQLWVGGTPTLLGPYLGLSLDDLFDERRPLATMVRDAPRIAPDPLLASPEYTAYLKTHPR